MNLFPSIAAILLSFGSTIAAASKRHLRSRSLMGAQGGIASAAEELCEGHEGEAKGICTSFCGHLCDNPDHPRCEVLERKWKDELRLGRFPCDPTRAPTMSPTNNPTESPTKNPTESPTKNPTKSPTKNPTESPTKNPTESPTKNPTESPTTPTASPTKNPTESPTKNPTGSPTTPTASPTKNPTGAPSPTCSFVCMNAQKGDLGGCCIENSRLQDGPAPCPSGKTCADEECQGPLVGGSWTNDGEIQEFTGGEEEGVDLVVTPLVQTPITKCYCDFYEGELVEASSCAERGLTACSNDVIPTTDQCYVDFRIFRIGDGPV